MKKQQTNESLYSDELEQLNFDQTEQEIHELFEQEGLPTSSELEKYNELMPSGAERILNIIEDERMHRREMELKKISGRNRLNQLISSSGLVLGIFLFLTIITAPYTIGDLIGYLSIWAIIVIVLILAPLVKSSLGNKN